MIYTVTKYVFSPNFAVNLVVSVCAGTALVLDLVTSFEDAVVYNIVTN